VSDCYAIVKALKLKEFEWDVSSLPVGRTLGFIAQEVASVLPASVKQGSGYGLSDFHYLDVDQIHKVMYGALVKLIENNERLTHDVDQLKKRLAELE
jgi:hypothetical protein